MSYYEEVFFFQEGAARPFIKLLDMTETLQEEQDFVKELVNQYWQPGNHMVVDENPAGPRDKKYYYAINEEAWAILNVNHDLPYVGLVVENDL